MHAVQFTPAYKPQERTEGPPQVENGSDLKMLKPSDAVETTVPGTCGCQCTSLTSD